MTNELTNPSNQNPYEAYGEQAAPRNGIFLKFVQGDFLAGQDSDLIPLGTRMIADMTQLTVGWLHWEAGRPVDRVMGLVANNFKLPRREDLGDNDEKFWEPDDRGGRRDPWQKGNELPMVLYDNPEEVYIFTSGSRGGEGAIGELSKIYGKHIRTHPNDLPVIKLDCDSYQHRDKTRGRIKFPVFEVVGWVNRNDQGSEQPEQRAIAQEQHVAQRTAQPAPRPDGTSPRRTATAAERAFSGRQAPDPVVEHERAEQAAKAARRRRGSTEDEFDVPFR